MAENTSVDPTSVDENVEKITNFYNLPQLDNIPEVTLSGKLIGYALVAVVSILAFISLIYLTNILITQAKRLFSAEVEEVYQKVFAPDQNRLIGVILLVLIDVGLLIFPYKNFWIYYGEIAIGLFTSIALGWLGSRVFERFFDVYLIDAAIQNRRKVNSELLIVAKLVSNAIIIVLIIIIFAQTHYLNIFGLFASLGVGGLAVAFAAQKVLEQLLGGVVLYVDRPFVVDDYIGLSDGTFGRVESIGLRSTKIRTSGKGTVMIIPNNSLTQSNIENFTGAKKVISLLYLTFEKHIPEEEKAFIRQIIIDSTQDIFGIDPRSTGVVFKELNNEEGEPKTQAQINFFILGSGEVAMDLRRQLLDVATQNISQQFKDYGIGFNLEERTINVDSPITI